MKKTGLSIILNILIFSCASLPLNYARAWLNTKRGAPVNVNVSGNWDAGNYMGGGWGVGTFIQEGDSFDGTLSAFNVKGVVHRNTLYMIIWGGNSTYTARLHKKPDGSFSGMAVYQAIIGSQKAKTAKVYPIVMKRMK